MRIGLCIIATGRYKQFLEEVLTSSERFFCVGHDVQRIVFTDIHEVHSPRVRGYHWRHIDHEPWPGPTLHRYRTMLGAADVLTTCDYIFYLDVDSRFVRPVGSEILGDLVATIHPGFAESPRQAFTYDTCPMSTAHVSQREGRRYYCGGFQGGRTAVYMGAMEAMARNIAIDEAKGVTACWHDESHWNRYLIDHPPTLELSHDYMCPAPWRPDTQRITIVGKDAWAMRKWGDA